MAQSGCAMLYQAMNGATGQRCLRGDATEGTTGQAEEEASPASRQPGTIFNLPTILTIGRVAAVPGLIGAFYWSSPWSAPVCTSLFIVAALTDFLDGYLARKMNATSAFGAFLDPVADKLMVAAVLVLLSTQPIPSGPFSGNSLFVPLCALAIIGREITMSALREWAAGLGEEAHKAVAVSSLGKLKTATQMVSLTMMLYASGGATNNLAVVSATAGPWVLAVATALTVWSLLEYFKGLWPFLSA
eukprot:CAMPEP_0117675672 /NCGR_PEP_ID=MMETSP0804-20121206/15739_1 /TAXON_ID=1074897 /ORGANISM="Tetraselmis astigmatica, Strain CCMP880" /LENGTH=244 /DNA_ID=CAMNT_0005484709 /DNA_START=326 /DNA_END=1061 /DNA_ORIENTATION=+